MRWNLNNENKCHNAKKKKSPWFYTCIFNIILYLTLQICDPDMFWRGLALADLLCVSFWGRIQCCRGSGWRWQDWESLWEHNTTSQQKLLSRRERTMSRVTSQETHHRSRHTAVQWERSSTTLQLSQKKHIYMTLNAFGATKTIKMYSFLFQMTYTNLSTCTSLCYVLFVSFNLCIWSHHMHLCLIVMLELANKLICFLSLASSHCRLRHNTRNMMFLLLFNALGGLINLSRLESVWKVSAKHT